MNQGTADLIVRRKGKYDKIGEKGGQEMKQESFSDMEYRCRKKKTKRKEILEIMDEIIP